MPSFEIEQPTLSEAAPAPPALPAERGVEQLTLEPFFANIDVTLTHVGEAIAVPTSEAEQTWVWFTKLCPHARFINKKRWGIPTKYLDQLLDVLPPHKVTLDAAAALVARVLWVESLGLDPLKVVRKGRRIVGRSRRSWPTEFRVSDAPWPAIASLHALGVRLAVDSSAHGALTSKLRSEGMPLAKALRAGSHIRIETNSPNMVERLHIPALAYDGEPDTGRYRVPLLGADALLRLDEISIDKDLKKHIQQANRRRKTTPSPEGFPWTLYPFQEKDFTQAIKILDVTGGVLLAGEQGSGKTTVSLAVTHQLDAWPLLVLSPLAAFTTWQRQLAEMGRTVYTCEEPEALSRQLLLDNDTDAILMSYDRAHNYVGELEQRGFESIICDEIQMIKNPNSRRSRAIRALAGAAPRRMGLSGTPINNAEKDILPLGAFLAPGEWPASVTKDLRDLYPSEDPVGAVAEHLGTMMVRRRMDDTGVKLPDREIKRVKVPLSPEQRQALAELDEECRQLEESGELEDRMHVFAKLTRMRKIIQAPASVGLGGPSPKTDAAVEIALEQWALKKKSVIFVADIQSFSDVWRALEREHPGSCVGIQGSNSSAERAVSEERFHNDPEVGFFVATWAASTAISLSPTGKAVIFQSLSYSPATLAQAAFRTYRLSADPEDTLLELYIHSTQPGGTLDDRIVELLEKKRDLIARIVDRRTYVSEEKSTSFDDLKYLLFGGTNSEEKASESA